MGKITLLNIGAISTIASTSFVAIASIFYVGQNKKSNQEPQAPTYSQLVHNEVASTNEVCFRDNFAPGMTAKINYHGRTINLARKSNGLDYAFFEIPGDATRRNGELEIIATDCEGNRSETKKLPVENGLIYESLSNQNP